jgi:uncharacterized protein YktA (UPF0223 family)
MRWKLVLVDGETPVKLMERLLGEVNLEIYYKDCMEEVFTLFENHYEDGMSAYDILQRFSLFKDTLPAKLIELRNNKEAAGELAKDLLKDISAKAKKGM